MTDLNSITSKSLSQEEKDALLDALISDYLSKRKIMDDKSLNDATDNSEYLSVSKNSENMSDILEEPSSKSPKEKIKERNKAEYRRIVSILRNRRIELDYNQREIALKAGVSFANISAIERGALSCNAETLIGYIKSVGLKYATFDNENDAGTLPAPNKYILPDLIKAIERLSEDDQNKLLNMIKTIWPV